MYSRFWESLFYLSLFICSFLSHRVDAIPTGAARCCLHFSFRRHAALEKAKTHIVIEKPRDLEHETEWGVIVWGDPLSTINTFVQTYLNSPSLRRRLFSRWVDVWTEPAWISAKLGKYVRHMNMCSRRAPPGRRRWSRFSAWQLRTKNALFVQTPGVDVAAQGAEFHQDRVRDKRRKVTDQRDSQACREYIFTFCILEEPGNSCDNHFPKSVVKSGMKSNLRAAWLRNENRTTCEIRTVE